MKRLWKFELTLEDKQTLYVGVDGNPDSASMFAAGCGDQAPVTVKIVSIKSNYEGGWCEIFPHTVVERIDTHERVRLRGYTWGSTGDVFAVQPRNLKWQ